MDKKTVKITEPCIGVALESYKKHLEQLEDDKVLKLQSIQLNDVNFEAIVSFNDEDDLAKLLNVTTKTRKVKADAVEAEEADDMSVAASVCGGEVNGLEKLLNLTKSISTSNIYAWSPEGKLTKYQDVEHILDVFYDTRFQGYVERKKAVLESLRFDLKYIDNRVRYIEETLAGTVDLRRKKEDVVNAMLKEKGYEKISRTEEEPNFNYLVKMPMDSVTEENVDRLKKQKKQKEMEIETLTATSEGELWRNDLDELEKQYDLYIQRRCDALKSAVEKETKPKKKATSVISVMKKVKASK
jgi:DNA topoisomerase-2